MRGCGRSGRLPRTDAWAATQAARQKLVSAKDLKKLRKQLNEKMEAALEVKSEMGSAQEQLRTLGSAVDELSKIMVDELDALGADTAARIAQQQIETSDQLSKLAMGVQAVTPEISALKASAERSRSAIDAANESLAKLKRWSESGFRRLNDVLNVQQQALAVLDSQMAGFAERVQEGRASVESCRQESNGSKAEFERMRTQVAQVLVSNEDLVREYREHICAMEAATAKCEAAATHCEAAATKRESRAASQLQDLNKVESMILEHRAISEARFTALENSARSPPTTVAHMSPTAERRVAELEEDLSKARRQLSQQDESIRDLQLRLQTSIEKTALTRIADRQDMSELVSRAVHDFMRKHPPPHSRSAPSYDPPISTWGPNSPRHISASSPMRPPSSLDTLQTSPPGRSRTPRGEMGTFSAMMGKR